MYGDHLHIFE